jgi:mannitol-1-phosphate/altronate dehydrogenase
LEVARQAGDGDEVFARADENAKDFDGVTAMGFVIAGLAARRALGNGGMTVMSCDNIPENGSTLHCKIMEKLDSVDKDLKQWVEDKCTFPNCMVDSITPGTDDKVRPPWGSWSTP